MQPIDPITEKACKSLYGKPVLLILHDGSRIFGVLSRFENDTLILNEEVQPKLNTTTAKKAKSKTAKIKSSRTTKTKSVSPGAEQEPAIHNFFGMPLFGGTEPAAPESPAALATPGQTEAIQVPLNRIAAMFSE